MFDFLKEDVDRLLSYNTKIQIFILDRWLGVTNVLLQILIVAYIVGYVFVYDRGYLEHEQARGVTSLALSQADDVPFVTSSGTSGGGTSGSGSEQKTRSFSVEELTFPNLENENAFVATSVKIEKQRRGLCEDLNRPCETDADCFGGGFGSYPQSSSSSCSSKKFCVERSWCTEGSSSGSGGSGGSGASALLQTETEAETEHTETGALALKTGTEAEQSTGNTPTTPSEIYKFPQAADVHIWAKSTIQFYKLRSDQIFGADKLGEGEKSGPVLYPNEGFNTFTVRDLLQMCDPPMMFEEVSELGAAVEVQFLWNCAVGSTSARLSKPCAPEVRARRVDSRLEENDVGFSARLVGTQEHSIGPRDAQQNINISSPSCTL